MQRADSTMNDFSSKAMSKDADMAASAPRLRQIRVTSPSTANEWYYNLLKIKILGFSPVQRNK
jgi:hypothetical protein